MIGNFSTEMSTQRLRRRLTPDSMESKFTRARNDDPGGFSLGHQRRIVEWLGDGQELADVARLLDLGDGEGCVGGWSCLRGTVEGDSASECDEVCRSAACASSNMPIWSDANG
jgi:hypothetical protein